MSANTRHAHGGYIYEGSSTANLIERETHTHSTTHPQARVTAALKALLASSSCRSSADKPQPRHARACTTRVTTRPSTHTTTTPHASSAGSQQRNTTMLLPFPATPHHERPTTTQQPRTTFCATPRPARKLQSRAFRPVSSPNSAFSHPPRPQHTPRHQYQARLRPRARGACWGITDDVLALLLLYTLSPRASRHRLHHRSLD